MATVEAVQALGGQQSMYDLTVDDVHTYYVLAGDQPVLVHNCDPGLDAIKIVQHANDEGHLIPGVDPDELDLSSSGL